MTCRFCGTWNPEHEHRCVRCSRRLQTAAPQPPEGFPVGQGALAPQLIVTERQMLVEKDERAPMQGTLFTPASFRPKDGSKVIPLITPLPPPTPPAPREAPRVHTTVNPRRATTEGQQRLGFPQPRVEADRKPEDSHIYCDAPVAVPMHRLLSSVVDLSIVLISCAMFLGAVYLTGAPLVVNKLSVPVFGAAFTVLGAFYYAMWSLAGTESIGMRSTKLRLLNFDGEIPTRQQRLIRFASGWLSLGAGCMGLLWSLVDEEKLTWHDHMSKTFPTPQKARVRYPVYG